MTQLQLFDPRLTPKATSEMLGDRELCRAIDRMRPRRRRNCTWPYVERLIEIDGKPAWLVDDKGRRYVVVSSMVWHPDELGLADPRLRRAATEAFARLDEIGPKDAGRD